ncbi:sensor domain-containing diguanylate cyclase [Modicisalibacter radicis]|uniref:sensor domain-containing diguanylate cyclase n=1 Tax=Halomonas sp. EAR18 TaxID=2518972 RepID=UPI00109C342E|nr:sensor domain-containing diguanylate cyclase [Halomonas sp. EAR18]
MKPILHERASSSAKRPGASTTWKTPQRLLIALGSLAVAAVGGFLFEETRKLEQRKLAGLEENLKAEATLLAEHAELTFSSATRLLMDIEWDNDLVTLRQGLTEQPFYQRILRTPQFAGLLVTDAAGEPVFTANRQPIETSRVLAQPLFAAHRAGEFMVIGEPFAQAGVQRRLIPVSQRLNAPDGAFAGVAVVLLDSDYFSDFYDAVSRNNQYRIGMFHADGTTLAVFPSPHEVLPGARRDLAELFGSHAADVTRLESPLDGSRRIAAYRNLAGFPLAVTVSRSYRQFRDELEPDRWRNTILFLIFAAGTLLSVGVISINLRTLERANRELDRLASTDALLGISNRRRFEGAIHGEWQRARRNAQPLSLLLIDVDYFKRYNDSYGHPAGDAALKQVAGVLCEAVARPGDLVARYGGEELVVLLPDTPDEGGLTIARRIHQCLARRGVPFDDSPIAGHLTVSIGVATLTPGRDASADDLVKRADDALYRAKSQGRNRTAVAGGSD